MRICLGQIGSVKGDVAGNIARHMAALGRFDGAEGDLVMFPELSLSGYAPDIAGAVALDPRDGRLDVFQAFADSSGVSVGIGAPTTGAEKPQISVVLFAPRAERRVIGKRYLHSDELPFFSPAAGPLGIIDLEVRVALAICYEISVPAHVEEAVQAGGEVYLASVAKTPRGVVGATAALRETARRYEVPVLMVNCVGRCEGTDAGGGSMVIDEAGEVTDQLGASDEGLLVYDTATRATAAVPLDG